LEHLLKTLPPERPDPFPHLADLSADQLLQRRVVITGQLKTLEQERQAIDATLLETFTDAELRFGVRAPGGWVLRQRSRTSWDYAPETRDAIKSLQQQAQRDGRAQPLVSTYLVAIQEST
jgi:3-methyladenine DNA glycosylase AlkD